MLHAYFALEERERVAGLDHFSWRRHQSCGRRAFALTLCLPAESSIGIKYNYFSQFSQTPASVPLGNVSLTGCPGKPRLPTVPGYIFAL